MEGYMQEQRDENLGALASPLEDAGREGENSLYTRNFREVRE